MHIPQLRRVARYQQAMAKARTAVFALAELMPHHDGPNIEFTRFMVNLKAELIRAGYIAAGDGKGGFLPAPLPSAAELEARRRGEVAVAVKKSPEPHEVALGFRGAQTIGDFEPAEATIGARGREVSEVGYTFHRQPAITIEAAAERFPIGQRVTFFPILPAERGEIAHIRSEPWALGHGEVVIKITGRAGGVAVTHLRAEPMISARAVISPEPREMTAAETGETAVNWRELCRGCGAGIMSGELCETCSARNDPFQTADNSGRDYGRGK